MSKKNKRLKTAALWDKVPLIAYNVQAPGL